MNHTTENLSATRAKVTVTLSGEETAAQDRAAMREVSKHARVPGFRTGKAPEEVLRKRFAKQIEDERIRRCHSAAYEFARDKAGLDVYNLVEVTDAIIKPGEEAAPAFVFDLQPEFTLPEYLGIETKVRPVVVEDAD
ncbi:MAG: trigger factor family protein, partial [Opitutales bacterium]|nr:trigger factor family protein [Opitutales bacterium]